MTPAVYTIKTSLKALLTPILFINREKSCISFLPPMWSERRMFMIVEMEASPSSHQDNCHTASLAEWQDKPGVKALISGLHLILWKRYCALKNKHIGSSIMQKQRTKLFHFQPVKPLVLSNESQQPLSCFSFSSQFYS